MITRVNSMSGTGAMSAVTSAALAQMKTELTTALKAAGITDASENDATPKGFPNNVTWASAYKMVSQWNSPATPGILTLSQDLVTKTVSGTKFLKSLGYNDLSKFTPGSSVLAAIDTLYQNKSNGLVASALAKAGIYDLTSFPEGTTAYQAFKMVEDPANPGKISSTMYRDLKGAFNALSAMGITSLVNFPRGSNALDAKAILEPKAAQMVAMTGLSPADFKNANLSALEQMGVISKMPNSIRELSSLPEGINANELATNGLAAKKLVALGYESLSAFAGMKAFGGKTVTATAALAQVSKQPVDADLPFPTAENTDKLFKTPDQSKINSYGKPNSIKNTLYIASKADKVTPNPPPIVTVTTTAEILAANIIYWQRKT